jgi:pilus assembly protein CpaE
VTATILLIGSTDRQLEDMLRSAGMQATGVPASHLKALAEPGAKQPDVLVLDVRGDGQLPPDLAALKRQHPATGVLIVAPRVDPALLLEAMRSGVNEVVAAPLNAADIEAAIARMVSQRAVSADTGQIFAFLGAKGGVGTTTVAVNVAAALAKLEPQKTLMVDLHVTNGDVAVFLGAEPRFSIVDALENTHRLDEAFLRGLVVRTKSGVDLLSSSDRVASSPIDPRRIRTLLEFCARYYKYIVLDVPRSETAVLDALELAGRIIVVANQELATVRSASRMAVTLRQRYGKDKLSIVLSRADRLAEIGHEDVERAVGSTVKHTFPSDYRIALQALNKGRPITLDNHNALSSSLTRFARSLAGVDRTSQGQPPASGGSLFGMFSGRK